MIFTLSGYEPSFVIGPWSVFSVVFLSEIKVSKNVWPKKPLLPGKVRFADGRYTYTCVFILLKVDR
jgi:hypothetical protein